MTVRCFSEVIQNPPPIGSIVTVKHSGIFSTGTLKEPVLWRERADLEAEFEAKNQVPFKSL